MKVMVLQPARVRVEAEIGLSGPNETGGLLLGWRRTDLDLVVVAEATGPGRDPVQGMHKLILDTEDLQSSVEAAFQRSDGAISFLGDWHLHHQAHPVASRQDKKSLRQLARSRAVAVADPLLVIVGRSGGELDWRCWHGPGARLAEIKLLDADTNQTGPTGMKISYTGGPLGAHILQTELEKAGLSVSADHGTETRGAGEASVQVVLWVADNAGGGLVGGAATAVVMKAVATVKERLPEAKIETEDD